MTKKLVGSVLAVALSAGLAMPVCASSPVEFDTYGGYTETKILYNFIPSGSVLLYNGEIDLDCDLRTSIYSGSTMYIPVGAYDTEADEPEEIIATDKMVKNDNIQLSYKVLQGIEYVKEVTLVSAKKEKLKDIPAGVYAKIQYSNDFFPLNKTKVSVRLVLSVNGVSYQDASVTFNCDLVNREEYINRNSVYGALMPAQFKTSTRYRGEASFDFGGDVGYTARVASGKKYYLNLDRTPDEDFQAMYPEVYLEFYNFKGNNDTFESVGKLVIPVQKEKFKEKKTKAEVYAYEVVGNQLRALTKDVIRYDGKTSKLILRTQTLGNYILSSRPLMKEPVGGVEEDILRSGYADAIDEPSDPVGTGGSSAK